MRLWEVIPIYSERKAVVVDECWMKSLGEIKFRLFRWWRWLFFWATVEVEYLDLDIADDIANISSSYLNHMHQVHVQSCNLWYFLFHILEIQKILIFDWLFFLQSGLLSFVVNSANGDLFFILLNIVLIVFTPMDWFLYQTSVRGVSITVR